MQGKVCVGGGGGEGGFLVPMMTPVLIRLMVSVDVKYHDYLLTV